MRSEVTESKLVGSMSFLEHKIEKGNCIQLFKTDAGEIGTTLSVCYVLAIFYIVSQ